MSNFFKVNVSTIIRNKNNEVLIQKRSLKEDLFPGMWGIPGGTVEHADKDLAGALKREVLEEVGVEIENMQLYSENIRKRGE